MPREYCLPIIGSSLHIVLLRILLRIPNTCNSTLLVTVRPNADQITKVGMLCVEYEWLMLRLDILSTRDWYLQGQETSFSKEIDRLVLRRSQY